MTPDDAYQFGAQLGALTANIFLYAMFPLICILVPSLVVIALVRMTQRQKVTATMFAFAAFFIFFAVMAAVIH